MTSTKLMLLGILLVLLGLATNTAAVQSALFRVDGFQVLHVLVYGAIVLFVAGFVVGLIGFFKD